MIQLAISFCNMFLQYIFVICFCYINHLTAWILWKLVTTLHVDHGKKQK